MTQRVVAGIKAGRADLQHAVSAYNMPYKPATPVSWHPIAASGDGPSLDIMLQLELLYPARAIACK